MQPAIQTNSGGINLEPGHHDDGWMPPPSVTLGDGTIVQLYKDGEALRAGFEAISAARKRICLEVYIFRSDPTGLAIAQLLAKKAREGVRVYVLFDSLGSLGSDRDMFEMMDEAGVRLGEFHPIMPWRCKYSWRAANRDHRKLLIIDDEAGGLGGLNVGSEYAGSWIVPHDEKSPAPWRDSSMGVRGPAVKLLLKAFARAWYYTQHGGHVRSMELLHNVESGEFGILGTVPTRRSPLAPLSRMLREARSSILLTMSYFAPPEELIDELCRAARRGVKVRLMLPAVGDVPLLLIAARSFYEKLLTSGVQVYERQIATLHAKTLCIDGHTTIIGSTNLDYRSIEYNCELSAIVRNEEFGRGVTTLFENDVEWARRISLKEWRRRPVWDRMVQWAVSRARYLL